MTSTGEQMRHNGPPAPILPIPNHVGPPARYVSLGEHINDSIKAIQARFRKMGLSNDGLSVMPVEAP